LVTLGGLYQTDQNDRASLEADKALELRTRDRARKLISKINEALQRLEDGVYGFCEDTGEPIGIDRLEARPIATLSIEAQERHERMEKTYDDEA
ncbi:MAG: TraR/DksA C4-type zinc finger protein, partial [Alphaproteobacteria bacterium]|nr:TraR/DksA C4-type zinc finger protein [Alphaproteobacteria bacterium]